MENLPKDAKICALLLTYTGVTSCEPKIISALQEYMFRNISNLLIEAHSLADYSGRPDISSPDIKMAIQFSIGKRGSLSLQVFVYSYFRTYYIELTRLTGNLSLFLLPSWACPRTKIVCFLLILKQPL